MSEPFVKPVFSGAVSDVLCTEITGDRRSRRRYAISLPIQIHVPKRHHVASVGTGKVVNISSRGIAMTTDESLNVGTLVELFIDWPALLDGKIPVRLVVEAVVVRTDDCVMAVEIIRHEFRTKRKQ